MECEIRVWQIVCDGCGEKTFDGSQYDIAGENAKGEPVVLTTKTQFRKSAIKAGWRIAADEQLCPQCMKAKYTVERDKWNHEVAEALETLHGEVR